MSREIKFRVFAKGVKKMLYFDNPGLVMCNFDEGPGYGMGLRLVGGHAYLGKYSDLMQYTGEHDCKGKKIYEDDIIHCNDGCCRIVEWVQDNGAWELQMLPNGDYIDPLFFGEFQVGEYVVIGNRWDNPELLGGAHDEH